ncbi:hypothetical protein GPROT1_01734 [Gammaproteobacteria bacterium]|nr:hypothetical protein GPROT1_01734 [Gammaproteobacteria bacterium]
MRNLREQTATASMQMKRYVLPLMTLLVLGQLVFLFTAFDVTGAAADLLDRVFQGR